MGITQVWAARGDRYHQHEEEYSSGGRIPFLVHRHPGGDVSHGHVAVRFVPSCGNYHAVGVEDRTPGDESRCLVGAGDDEVEVERPEWAEGMAGVRRRQAEMDALL